MRRRIATVLLALSMTGGAGLGLVLVAPAAHADPIYCC